ncbi:von Willebrand factor type A domain-containing protein [Sulfurivirga caldicuralii]|uniref:von Willebrand factor type A domain-containing protein n=1 Tax=Sulfurivirga caldicuralii TaxID=364032 RepID=A0A1N6HDW8_9GAMM|nr:VWA domain-containing protein [Sulfurivirga caldicuralii]SIO17982.1 von Willebrand factor type A domain-containing protein [Sulfurivirga caldicuralii]
MLRIEQPLWLGLLAGLALLALWRLWRARLEQRAYADEALLPWVALGRTQRWRPTAWTVLQLGTALLIVALSNPQWGERRTQSATQVAADVVFLLDLSRSMGVDDIPPSRFDAARTLIDRLLAALGENSRAGLRVFDGQSHWVVGITKDHSVVRYFLKRARVDSLPTRGSRVELALGQTAAALQRDGVKQATVVLLSDGHAPYWAQQPRPPALAAYGKAYQLLTVGMGTPQGGFIRDDKAADGVLYFRNEKVRAPLYETMLQGLTTPLGGTYWRYDSGAGLVDALKQRIQAFSAEHASASEEWQWHSLRPWFLGSAFVLFVLAFWSVRWRRR